MKQAPLKKVFEKGSDVLVDPGKAAMLSVFLATVLIFLFGMGIFIFLMYQARKLRRSQGK